MLDCYYYLRLLNSYLFMHLLFYFLLGKGGFSLDQGLGEGRRMTPGLPAGSKGLSSAPRRSNFRERLPWGPGPGEPPGRWALGYGFPPRLIVRTLGRCPPSSHISTVHHPQAPGAALSPLPRALLGALNNDICMQGAIHKYVRAGEI